MYGVGADKLVVLELKDEFESIRDRLIGGTIDRDIVSIVGMGGIGKTTMARKLYQELDYQFHTRAFCCVTQRYDKQQLLVEVLNQVTHDSYRTEQMNYEDLGEELYRSLKGRRYLIVLDDMWDIEAWNDVGIYFPDDCNQSRILVTSRQNEVALQVKPDSSPHYLRLLSEEESWELLEKRTFLHQGSCPPELLAVGRKIAKSCRGLPIAVVLVAGILARTEQERDKWEQIAESVGKAAQIECLHIFELSYNHLPEQLKECFLYFAAFKEGAEIQVRKLIGYWVAEGYMPGAVNKCSEDLAEGYLMELFGRSLVMVSKRNSKGGIKTCHLHDFIHEFCSAKAKEVSFMQRLNGYVNGLSASQNSNLLAPRVSIYGGSEDLRILNPGLRSLLLLGYFNWNRFKGRFSFIYGFDQLRVLDMDGIKVDKYIFRMDFPVNLKYLSICGFIESIPPSITDLLNLETLIVRTEFSKVDLPYTIWKMVKLRHLHIRSWYTGSIPFIKLPAPTPKGILQNLQTLSFLSVSYEGITEDIREALPSIQRLKCCIPDLCPQLDLITQLESLQLHVTKFSVGSLHSSGSRTIRVSYFKLPSNLKNLSLSRFKLSKANISTIVSLHNLEVLKLLSADFEEDNWYMEDDDQFLKLKFLKLSLLDIGQWNASGDNFPSLEKLVVDRCRALESIPSSFGEIPTLKSIDVIRCRSSLNSSVRQIQEEQIDMGNQDFKLDVRD